MLTRSDCRICPLQNTRQQHKGLLKIYLMNGKQRWQRTTLRQIQFTMGWGKRLAVQRILNGGWLKIFPHFQSLYELQFEQMADFHIFWFLVAIDAPKFLISKSINRKSGATSLLSSFVQFVLWQAAILQSRPLACLNLAKASSLLNVTSCLPSVNLVDMCYKNNQRL